jgi:superfamily I DNA/RNA helicase
LCLRGEVEAGFAAKRRLNGADLADFTAILSKLNPEQRAAVEQTEGPVLVLAGAGSGKTRVITTRIAWLLHQGLAAPENILALTFTNKAASEMRERVARLVGKRKAAGIVLSTFHSFCVRVLRAEIEQIGYRRNFTISSESDMRTLLRRTLQDFDGGREAFDASLFLERIGNLKSSGQTPDAGVRANPPSARAESEAQRKYREWLPEVYDRYQSALRAANTLDFDDLLLLTLRLWRECPEVRQRYREQFRYVMVDEYQDTNRVQYQLLMELTAESRNLCVVGDDDQSIYGWRGADIANILSFEKDFREAKIVTMAQNYRSRKTILAAANSVIGRNRERRPKNLWSSLGEGRAIDWIVTGDEEHEAKEAVAWLRHIQSRSEARYSDFAILYRSNLQSRPFELALRAAKIPYVVFGGQDFFERAEIKDIVAYLRLISNPQDEPAFLRIVNVPRRGIGDKTLHRVHDVCRLRGVGIGKALAEVLNAGDAPSNTRAGIGQFLGLIAEFRKRFRACEGKLAETTSELIDAVGYREDLFRSCKSAEQFEARWGNVTVLLDALSDYQAGRPAPTLSGFLDESALASTEDRQGKEQRRDNGVALMTIHSAKGLEFPFVFVVGMEDGLLPHEKSMREAALPDAQLEEERRLFYVALTRAKRHVTLFESLSRERGGRRKMTATSRFMKEIPPELVKQQVRAVREMVEQKIDQPAPKRPGKRGSSRRSQPSG